MMTTREALEAALVANPDDTALHAAYADLLIEDGDPRGESIRLALLAEDRNQPASQLRAIEQAMYELRLRHEAEWLGPLAWFLERPRARSVAEPMEPNVSVVWRRGWIDAVRIGQLNQELIAAIAACPLTRLLGELSIEQNRSETRRVGAASVPGEEDVDLDDFTAHLDMMPLADAGRFRNLRVFKLGSFVDGILADGWDMEEYLGEANRLEDVRVCCEPFSSAFLFGGNFSRLLSLQTIHITGRQSHVPFALLGNSQTSQDLRTLFIDTESLGPTEGDRHELSDRDFHALHRPECLPVLEYFTLRDSSVGDNGLRLILEAPFYRRLKGLDLCRCNITDEGADLLANHPHTPQFEYLRLAGNQLSPIGIDALDAIGFTIGEQAFGMPMPFDDGFPEDVPPDGGVPL